MNQAAGISMPTEANIPKDDWEQVLLDSVAKRGSGHTPDKKHPEYWDGSIKWISLQDSAQLDALYIEDTAATITAEGIKNSSAVLHQKGTVVLSRDAGVGKSAIMADDMAVSQHFMAWTCGQRLDNHFLYYWLQSKKPEFERIANGNTIKTIGLPYFKELTIPLPTVEEQKRIASALSDIDTLISSLDQLIVKKRNIHQATMQQLLTGQRRLPGFSGKWEEASLGEISLISKGEQLSQRGDAAGLIPHFNGGVSASSYTDTANTPENTIAISEGGNSCGFVQFITTPFWCGGHCYAVRPRGIENLFLYFALKGKEDSIMGLRVGSGLPNIQKSALNSFQIALPSSRDEQTSIATILADMDIELAALETRRDKACQLKQGMMQELLTGRIRLTNQGV